MVVIRTVKFSCALFPVLENTCKMALENLVDALGKLTINIKCLGMLSYDM